MWNNPVFIMAREVGETIEFIYKETSKITFFGLGGYLPTAPSERVYKIIYSCKDGKWNKSEPVYGTVIPASGEEYIFD